MSHKIEPPEKQELEDYYLQYGVSLSDVARKYNSSNATVRKWMKSYNIQRKTHLDSCREKNSLSSVQAKHNQKLIHDISNNMSIKGIEKKYNIGQSTIYDIIDQNKIQRNSLSQQCIEGWREKNKYLYNENEILSYVYFLSLDPFSVETPCFLQSRCLHPEVVRLFSCVEILGHVSWFVP
jgi:transposase